jgi:hypothetical protein|tara:strand:+ start:11214 stop:12665 length:1452 start_codon:yes stop_codon:yes gene_type:complete
MLICIIPKIEPDAPTAGPAILKSHLEAANYTCEVLDLNIKLFRALVKRDAGWWYWYENDRLFSNRTGVLSDDFNTFYGKHKDIILSWIYYIRRKNPRFVGMSLLTSYSQSVAIKLSELIKEYLPHIKIIWGGAHIDSNTRVFVESGLIDYYIYGDGEHTLIEFMRGNYEFHGINSKLPNQLADLDSILLPNYDNIVWDEYEKRLSEPIYITGSRGCVKRCDFCNVYEIWPDYKFRKGDKIANEIRHVNKKYGRNTFLFTDSLINGSMKAFRELLTELTEYKIEVPGLKWQSQWIIRSKSQSPESDYIAMKASGCVELDVGIESFNQDTRFNMGKKFTDEDMWWCFDILQKHKIRHTLLLINGYPGETQQHHDHTLDTIKQLFALGYANSIDEFGNKLIYFSFNSTLILDDGLPIWKKVKDDLDYWVDPYNWSYRGVDMAERIRRFDEITALIKELGNQEQGFMTKRAVEDQKKVLFKEATTWI